MATVKSLEERTDDLVGEMSSLSTSIAVLTSRLDGFQATLAVAVNAIQTMQPQLGLVASKLDTVVDRLGKTESKLEMVTQDYTSFKAKMDTAFSLTKWFGALLATLIISLIGAGFYIARSAGKLEGNVEKQQETLNEIKTQLRELRSK
jgi:chromosome segregation ATPase